MKLKCADELNTSVSERNGSYVEIKCNSVCAALDFSQFLSDHLIVLHGYESL